MTRSLPLLPVLLAGLVAGAAACQVEPVPEDVRRGGASPDTAPPDAARADRALEERVRAVLARSAAGWNRGDLAAFMEPYREAPTTTYVGGSGLRVGYGAIRQRYAPLFEAGARRDSLRFEDLRVRRLAGDVAVGTARWILYRRGDDVTETGPFTLVLRRVGDGWKIVHDHSSSYEGEASGGGADGEDAPPAGGTGSRAGEADEG